VVYINAFGCDEYGGDIYRAGGTAMGGPADCTDPHAQYIVSVLFFLAFVIVGALVMINLFVGLICTAMGSAIVELTRNKEVKIALAKVVEKCQVSKEDKRVILECYRLMDNNENGVLEYSELFFGLQAALHHYPLPAEVMEYVEDEEMYRKLLVESRNDRKLDGQTLLLEEEDAGEDLIIQPIDKAWFVAFCAHMNMKTAHALEDEPRYRSRLGFKHLTQALSWKSKDVRSSVQSFEAAEARIQELEKRLVQKQIKAARLEAENVELEARLEAIKAKPIEITMGLPQQWTKLGGASAGQQQQPQQTQNDPPTHQVSFGENETETYCLQQRIASSDRSNAPGDVGMAQIYSGGVISGIKPNEVPADAQDEEPGIRVYV
jgi:hypothetical protein